MARPKKLLPGTPEANKEKWPKVVIIRRASNGKEVSTIYRCRSLSIHEDNNTTIEADSSAREENFTIDMCDVERVDQ